MTLLSLLVLLLVLALVYWAAHKIVSVYGLPPQVVVVIDVVLVILIVWVLLGAIGWVPATRLR